VLALAAAGLAAAAVAAGAPRDRPVPVGHGAWSWFGDPRAVTRHGLTFIGWIDARGDVRIASYDRRHRRVNRGPVLKRHLGRDDHNNPALLVRPDGRLMVFFSPHSGHRLPPPGIPSRMYFRLSRRPWDIRRFGPLRTVHTNTPGNLGYTYPNPVGIGRTVFLFWRGGNWQPSLSTWRAGRGWSPARTVIRGPRDQRPYAKYASQGRSIDIAFTDGNPGSAHTSILYARLRDGRFLAADGSRLGRLAAGPLAARRADRVYDGRGRGGRAWIMDTAIGRGGRPAMVFASYPRRRRIDYRYATWAGGRWRQRVMLRSQPPLAGRYPAGASLDHGDPRIVVLSRMVRGRFEVERWRTPDGGRTWTSTAVTARSREHNIRPVVPRGGGPVVWMRGRYRHWRAYFTDVVLAPGVARVAPPAPRPLDGP
jgi:hypothetical protein